MPPPPIMPWSESRAKKGPRPRSQKPGQRWCHLRPATILGISCSSFASTHWSTVLLTASQTGRKTVCPARSQGIIARPPPFRCVAEQPAARRGSASRTPISCTTLALSMCSRPCRRHCCYRPGGQPRCPRQGRPVGDRGLLSPRDSMFWPWNLPPSHPLPPSL